MAKSERQKESRKTIADNAVTLFLPFSFPRKNVERRAHRPADRSFGGDRIDSPARHNASRPFSLSVESNQVMHVFDKSKVRIMTSLVFLLFGSRRILPFRGRSSCAIARCASIYFAVAPERRPAGAQKQTEERL